MPLDPVIPILETYSREILTHIQNDLQCSIACNSEKLETTQMSINKGVGK